MALGLGSSLVKGGASLLTYVKDNLKLYLDFKSNKSDTLKFPSEGSTEFNGSSDYIETSDSADFDFGTGDFSISFWFNVDDIDWNWAVSRTNSANSDDVFRAGINNSGKIIFRDRAGGVDVAGSTTILINTWYHFFAVRNSGILKVYLNGSEDGSASSGGNLDSDKGFSIGKWQGNGDYWNGQLTNVAVWSRALAEEEVQSIMNKSYSQLKGVEKTSLVSWWALDTETLSDNLATSWANGAGDAEVFNTDGANIVSLVNSSGQVNVTTNSFATRYRVYKVSYDYTLVSGDHPFFFTATNTSQDSNVPTSSTMASLGSSWYFTADTGTNFAIWRGSNFSISVDNFSIQEVISADSHGSNTGYYSSAKSSAVSSHNSATTTTSVYGGNAPILPRAVDVAKEGQADAIGNGSALFNRINTDYIEIKNTGIVLQNWTISFWVRTGANFSSSGYPGLVSTRSGANNDYTDGVTLHYFNDYFDAEGASQLGHLPKVAGNTNLDDGEWYHVVHTCDRNGTNKQYINGIFITEKNAVNNPTNADTIQIGARFYGNGVQDPWDGNIAQVGFWQGILDQPKVQKLYESTSYSKIPADVKSTLGSEILTTNVNTDWSAYGSNDVDNVTDGVKITHVDNAGGAQRTIAGSSGKLYKVVFNAYYSGGTAPNVKVWTGAVNSGTQALTTSSAQYTIYFKNAGTSSLYFDSVNSSQEIFITNLSAKEVTNDIVAYYPLDADSSANGVTQDVTTGEVLGTNLFTDSTFDLSGTQSANTLGTHWRTGTAWTIANGEAIYDGTAHENRLELPSPTLQSAGLYKFSFTISDANTKAAFKIKADGNDIIPSGYYDNGDHVIYYNQAGAYGSPKTIKIEARNDVHGAFKLQNASWELVTSNTGVLK